MTTPAVPYRYGVTGFEYGMQDTLSFTYMVRTLFGAKLVEKRLFDQGLYTMIYDIERVGMPPGGLNPYYEADL